VTREQWLELADRTDAQAIEAARAGDTHRAATLSVEAERMRLAAKETGRLSEGSNRGNKSGNVGQTAPIDLTPDPLVAAAAAEGLSLRDLADEAGCTHALLSAARRGRRSIKRKIVDRIEKRVGFAATPENWPGGISDR
jgi:hypothetical protein